MAATEFIDRASRVLEEQVLEVKSILEMCDDCTPDSHMPSWLFVMRKKIIEIDMAVQDLQEQFHRHARPILTDFEKVNRR